MSHKFDSNPKSFCLSRIFRKQETNKGQLISRNRQENEPGPYATAEKSLPTEKSLRSNAASQWLSRCSHTLLRNLARFPRILTSVSILIVHVLLCEEPIKLEIEIHCPRVYPGDQPLTKSRRNSGLEIGAIIEPRVQIPLPAPPADNN